MWDLEDAGKLRLASADVDLGFSAMSTWDAGPNTRLVQWSWPRLLKRHREAFALIDADEVPRALWCSSRDRLLRLPGGDAYELGYFEICPRHRGGPLGYYALAIIAGRALEVGAKGMVLASLPERRVRQFYGFAGGVEGKVKGWQTPFGLVPYFFPEEALRALQEDAHARQSP